MIQQFDFHLHTNNSDGEYTVEQLVQLLRKANIKYFSITDHDNLNSTKQIQNVDISDMNYCTGVEISAIHNDKYEMHILGYGFDPMNKELNDGLNWCKAQRQKRILEISKEVEKRACITMSEEEKEYLLNQNNPGRPHLAKILVDHKVCRSTDEAFASYLSGLKSTVKYRLSTKEAFDLIHKANGKVLWAHPVKVERKYKIDICDIIDELIELGLDGVEIGNSLHSYYDLLRFQSVASDKGLLTSAGSDYHGPFVKPDVAMGVVYNSDEEKRIELNDLNFLKEVMK